MRWGVLLWLKTCTIMMIVCDRTKVMQRYYVVRALDLHCAQDDVSSHLCLQLAYKDLDGVQGIGKTYQLQC